MVTLNDKLSRAQIYHYLEWCQGERVGRARLLKVVLYSLFGHGLHGINGTNP
jgi:hypothetical protein